MSKTITINLVGGSRIEVYGYVRVKDNVLTVVETYGDGTGTKEITNYPLVHVRSWKEDP